MKKLGITIVGLLAMSAGAWAQSLLKDDSSPYDPPRRPALKKHDHVQIQFPSVPKGSKELADWLKLEGKEATAAGFSITAEVADLRPNGVIVLQAIRRRAVNRTEEIIRLTAEVASERVSMNRVSSEHVANLTVGYEGPSGESAKPDLWAGFFGRLWPF